MGKTLSLDAYQTRLLLDLFEELHKQRVEDMTEEMRKYREHRKRHATVNR